MTADGLPNREVLEQGEVTGCARGPCSRFGRHSRRLKGSGHQGADRRRRLAGAIGYKFATVKAVGSILVGRTRLSAAVQGDRPTNLSQKKKCLVQSTARCNPADDMT